MKYNSEKITSNCDCARCKAIASGKTEEEADAEYQAWEKEKLSRLGWIIHYTRGDRNSPTGVNIHTHGLEANFDHTDLQVVLPIEENHIQSILHLIVDRIKDGDRFVDGEMVEGILGNGMLVKMVEAKEDGRSVLRVIFPDQSGNCDAWSMDDPYLRQYEDLVELPELDAKFKPKKSPKWVPFKP